MAEIDATATNNINAGSEPTVPGQEGTPPETPVTDSSTGDTEGEKPPEKPEVETAPETYAEFKSPKGLKLNQDVVGEFSTLAKELNLSQDRAQKLIDLSVKNAQGILNQQNEAWDTTRKGWVAELKADQDFGGEKLTETVERAKRVLKDHGSDKLSSFLESTGYGDNPDIVKFLAKIDKALGEDRTVDGSAGSGQEGPTGDLFYGKK